MAALRPCPSGLVVGASQVSLSTLSPRIVRPFGRRGSASLLNLRTSTARTAHRLRHRHAIGAHKGAGDWRSGQDPDDEKHLIEEQVKMFREIFKEHYKLEKDMPFREDIEKIDEYEKAMTSWNTSIFHIEATTFSLCLCVIATKGVKLASRVMDSAALRLDKQDEISSCTTKQTLTMGVAAIGHILLQDALANVNYVGYSYSLVLDADDTWREFEQTMNNLEEKFRAVSKSTKAYEILWPTMVNAVINAISFISTVVARHERVLGYAPGTYASSAIWIDKHCQVERRLVSSTLGDLLWPVEYPPVMLMIMLSCHDFLQVPRGGVPSGLQMMGNPMLRRQAPVPLEWQLKTPPLLE